MSRGARAGEKIEDKGALVVSDGYFERVFNCIERFRKWKSSIRKESFY